MPSVKDLITDELGEAYDLIAVMGCIGFLAGLVLCFIKCFHHIDFSVGEYAGGFSVMIAATAAARRIQPPAVPTTPPQA